MQLLSNYMWLIFHFKFKNRFSCVKFSFFAHITLRPHNHTHFISFKRFQTEKRSESQIYIPIYSDGFHKVKCYELMKIIDMCNCP